MKTLMLLTILTVSTLSLTLAQQSHVNTVGAIRVGGFNEGTPVLDENSLDAEHSRINQFIRNNVPEVKGLKLYSYRQQVVAGINYCFTYDSATQPGTQKVEICAWSKVWQNNFLQVKRPDGSVVNQGGLNSIAPKSISTTITRLP